jgi:hypothetical protein
MDKECGDKECGNKECGDKECGNKEAVKEEKSPDTRLTADKDSDGNGNFSNDNVNVGITPDVKSNNVLVQICSCSLVFSCCNKFP